MSKTITKLMVAALITVAVPSYISTASAAPVSGALAIKNAVPANVENVYWRAAGAGAVAEDGAGVLAPELPPVR
jgi:hypothetical protein